MGKIKNRSTKELIAACGGPDRLCHALGFTVTAQAIYRWQHYGIPDRYWPIIIECAQSSAEELLAANLHARKQRELV